MSVASVERPPARLTRRPQVPTLLCTMILPVVKYGHPMLRQKGARIEKITPAIKKLIDDMLETMHAAAGVGLAAHQVGHALPLTGIDVREARDRPSTLVWKGQPVEVAGFMPLVLINPELTASRSEERRVGKECRSRWSPYH